MGLSMRFKDRPKTPKEEVVYWTEYTIKHKGAHHLKSAALKLSWYQYLLIDVLVTIGLVSLVTVRVVFAIFRLYKNQLHKSSKAKNE